jgi:cation/acetate symporter
MVTVLLIVLSPTVWVDVMGRETAPFPLRNPAIVSMTVAFAAAAIASLLTREPRAESRFEDEKLRTYLGIGAE